MEIELIHDPFEYTDKVFITMSAEELRLLRFDMSLAVARLEDLDALSNFLYDTDDV